MAHRTPEEGKRESENGRRRRGQRSAVEAGWWKGYRNHPSQTAVFCHLFANREFCSRFEGPHLCSSCHNTQELFEFQCPSCGVIGCAGSISSHSWHVSGTLSEQQVFVGPASQVISLNCSHLIGPSNQACRALRDSPPVFTKPTLE